MTVRRSIGVSG